MRQFGFKIDDELSLVEAHISPAPVVSKLVFYVISVCLNEFCLSVLVLQLTYVDDDTKGQEFKDNTLNCQPEMGHWDIKNKVLFPLNALYDLVVSW